MGVSPVLPDQPILSREHSEFLHELAQAVQRFTMYPDGHPMLAPSVDGVRRRLDALFRERRTVAFGVGPNHLVVQGVKTEPNQGIFRDLAQRLHGKNVGGVKFSRGLGAPELQSFLSVVAAEITGTEHDEPEWQWPHLQLFPLRYDHLELFEESELDPEDQRFGGKWATQLWVDLAQVVLGDDVSDERAAQTLPEQLAAELNKRPDDRKVQQKVIRTIRDLADACKTRGRSETLALQRELSKMIASLDPSVLRRLLEMGGNWLETKQFLADTANVMSAETIVRLVAAAAEAQGRSLSPALLQLLTKMAVHVDQGSAQAKPKTDLLLRQRLDQILQHLSPAQAGVLDAYGEKLSLLPPAPSEFDPVLVYGAEPQRMVLMSIELGIVSAATRRAVERFVGMRQVDLFLDLLERVPADDPVVQELRGLVHTPFVVQSVLAAEPVNCDTLARLVPRAGLPVLPALLDRLALEEDRRVRARLIDIVAELGPGIAPEVVRRIPGAPWFVQRNMIKLLGMLPEAPGGVSLTDILGHGDYRVRHEALKILLRDPVRRTDALKKALEAPDLPTVRLAIQTAAEHGCPKEAVYLLLKQLEDNRELDDRVRASAIRAIAPVNDVRVLRLLVRYTLTGAPLPFLRRLQPKSREMLAALQGLATHWQGYPEAEPVLKRAARHKDGEVRKAGFVAPQVAPAQPPRVIV